MNIWHDIAESWITPDSFTAVIEIPKGGKNKYEMDKETGLLRLDRVLYTATHYPANYGFIPRTYADDGDPLDVLVLCQESIVPMTLVQCYPIGVIQMVDGTAVDEKIIAVPHHDPSFSCYREISDLPSHTIKEIEHFFTIYKMLEQNKVTKVDATMGHDQAVSIINHCMEEYRLHYCGKRK